MTPLAALFDLDGTLHDRAASLRAYAQASAREWFDDRRVQAAFVSRFIELDADGSVWKDRVFEALRETFSFGPDAALPVDDLVTHYLTRFPRHARLMRGAGSLLADLRTAGIKLAIVTNGRADLQGAVIESLGLNLLVDTVVVSESEGVRKPDARIFELALERLGVDASRAVMVGDDIEADVVGALQAGLKAIALDSDAAPALASQARDLPDARRLIGELLGVDGL